MLNPKVEQDGVVMDEAERHRAIAGTFTERVGGTPDWDVPTPVPEWTARDVVGHLTGWLPGLLGTMGVHLEPGPPASEDPVGAWRAQAESVQALLDDPESAARVVEAPYMGTMALGALVDRIYTTDVFMHTWDLARATGQDDRLDAAACEELLTGMVAMEDAIRSSGQFGTAVAVPADADPQTRLLGFIGRDPGWRPPTAGA
jgi:uncharacterized protein (TIGR03086 family)